ncbi:MAG: HPr family phosphocarrier protein [Candidatus Omnitrophica bacterium]|nr:HPr family phosphocarrier protein [Candidatus Omnitrophota bacterium]
MPLGSEDKEIVIKIPCQKGLHMRSAANFVNFAKQFKADIKLTQGAVTANAKSILGILLLGAVCCSHVKIRVTGEDAGPTLEALKAYFQGGIGCVDEEASTHERHF